MTKKKKNKLHTNTNAGNVEYNIAFFNSMNGVNNGGAEGEGGGMGEALNDAEYNTDDFFDMANKADDMLCFPDGTCINGVQINKDQFVDEVGEEYDLRKLKNMIEK